MLKICSHRNQTIIYHEEVIEDELFDFTGWQCDDCGMLLNRDITDEEIIVGIVAKFDKSAYENALKQALLRVLEIPTVQPGIKTAQFIQAAVKDARQRRSDRKR